MENLNKIRAMVEAADSGIALSAFEIPVQDQTIIEPDQCVYPVDFSVNNNKLYMDGVIIKGERPIRFVVHLVKDGQDIPESLLERAFFMGGQFIKNKRYYVFISE